MRLPRSMVGAMPVLALLGCASAPPLRPALEVRWCAGPVTALSPVEDYDQPPRPITIDRPRYPREAFVRKVQGVVTVEIVIGPTGRVVRAQVTRSIPGLDEAALDCVCEWTFEPAAKDGKPVATLADAPVGFRIYNDKDDEQETGRPPVPQNDR